MSVDPRIADGSHCYDCDSARCTCEADAQDWIAADREYGRRIHRTNRLMLAIELVEKIIDQLPEGSKEAALMWEKNDNLCRALVAHRRMGFTKNNQRQAQQPRQILKGN